MQARESIQSLPSKTREESVSSQLKNDSSMSIADARPRHTTQRHLQNLANASRATTQLAILQAKIQSKPDGAQLIEEDELLQGVFETVQRVEVEEPLQVKSETAQREQKSKPNNTGLPDQLKSGIEAMSGMSMDHVKVHYNSSQPAQLNAHAYAQGSEIHIAPGQEQHLPHEAWHVVQQAQGRVKPTMQMKENVLVNDDAGLESEADIMGERALDQTSDIGSRVQLRTAPAVAPVSQRIVQRARGGIEFTEDGPTMLYAFPAANFVANVPAHNNFTVAGRPMTSFQVGAGTNNNLTLGANTNEDFDVVRASANVKLTNDVESAEWIIERHQADLPAQDIRRILKEDVAFMFQARDDLATAVTNAGNGHAGEVGIVSGTKVDTNAAPQVFIYKVGPKKGKAQITAQYSNEETIRRINKLNASKFLTGSKVAVGEDLTRVSGTENRALRNADIAGTTSFSTAGVLLGGLVGASNAIPKNGDVGDRLSDEQVGLVKLMVINDAMANTMVRYQDVVGQGQEKNIQRFFPKSRRNEYVRAVAQADLDAVEMAALRAEIKRTSVADALLLFNSADPGALRTDEAFTELMNAGQAADAINFATAKGRALDPTQGAPDPAHLLGLKNAVLGLNGALLVWWIDVVAEAYTDLSVAGDEHVFHDPGKAQQSPGDIANYGLGNGGVVGSVIETSRGFTPVQGRGAIYEMREREIDIDKSGYFNIGSMSEINNAIDKVFGAAD